MDMTKDQKHRDREAELVKQVTELTEKFEIIQSDLAKSNQEKEKLKVTLGSKEEQLQVLKKSER